MMIPNETKGAANREPPFFWHAVARALLQYHTIRACPDKSHATRHDHFGCAAPWSAAPRHPPSQPGATAGATSMALPDLFRRVKASPVRDALARLFNSAQLPR